jgi:hypothetical protein
VWLIPATAQLILALRQDGIGGLLYAVGAAGVLLLFVLQDDGKGLTANRKGFRAMTTDLHIVNKYRLEEPPLAKGGMGVLYRAAQLDPFGEFVREVAIKMIRADLATEDPDLGRTLARSFLREMHSAARVRNPHCVAVFDFGRTEDGGLYYVMELVPEQAPNK